MFQDGITLELLGKILEKFSKLQGKTLKKSLTDIPEKIYKLLTKFLEMFLKGSRKYRNFRSNLTSYF